jgi:ribA/ribD-fused uncharacterized protein
MSEHVEPLDVESLCAAVDAGFAPKMVFFWGHTAKAGVLGNECFSQWYESPFVVGGERYPTAEHFMMVGKARLFGDEETAARIMASQQPAQVKKLGREVRDFDEARWAQHRFQIVAAGSHAKFSQSTPLKSYLLATGSRVLVEASPTDRVWGIGLAAKDPRARDPKQWGGLNLLGFALMHARAEISAGR